MNSSLTLYKLIILYMLNQVDFPLTNSQISNFILSREYTTYFPFQQALIELEESRLIEVEKIHHTSYYRISTEGKYSLEAFFEELSPQIRQEVKSYLIENKYELRNEVATRTSYELIGGGDYQVSCQVFEENRPILELNLIMPTEEMAIQICQQWKEKHNELYQKLILELLNQEE